ncbi:MAG: DUF2185 domain-containing protein [Bacillota bacterium]
MTDAAYTLLDPRPLAANAPYTFFLPSSSEVAAVGKGDLVKLIFDYPHETEKWAAERMWVSVKATEGDDLRGVLDSHPDEPTAALKAGDQIAFQRHHIIAIDWANPETAPRAAHLREFWDRCLVDQCVLDGEEPVEYLYREEPERADDAGDDADSGWRIRGRMGESTEADLDAREVAYVALGAVLNRDDSWIEWIDAPVGTRLVRDFGTNTYVELE